MKGFGRVYLQLKSFLPEKGFITLYKEVKSESQNQSLQEIQLTDVTKVQTRNRCTVAEDQFFKL